MFPATKISNMSTENAKSVLENIRRDLVTGSVVYPARKLIECLRDAATHSDEDIVMSAIDVMVKSPESYEFTSDLAYFAEKDSRRSVSLRALNLMIFYSVKDNFIPALKSILSSPDDEKVSTAMHILREELRHRYSDDIVKAISSLAFHKSDDISIAAITILSRPQDLTILSGVLTEFLDKRQNPQYAGRAAVTLDILEQNQTIAGLEPVLNRIVRNENEEYARKALGVLSRPFYSRGAPVFTKDQADIIIWALENRREDAVKRAAITCTLTVQDKTHFMPFIKKHGMSRRDEEKTIIALTAMRNTSNPDCLHDILEYTINGTDDVARNTVFTIRDIVERGLGNDRIKDILRTAMTRNDTSVFIAVKVIGLLQDKGDFIADLKSVASRFPQMSEGFAAKDILREIQKDMASKKQVNGPALVNARLDFSLSAGDQYQNLHPTELLKAVKESFNHHGVGGLVEAKAKLFYVEEQLSRSSKVLKEGDALLVTFAEHSKDDIETFVAQGLSPKCTVFPCEDGSYRVVLLEQPKTF